MVCGWPRVTTRALTWTSSSLKKALKSLSPATGLYVPMSLPFLSIRCCCGQGACEFQAGRVRWWLPCHASHPCVPAHAVWHLRSHLHNPFTEIVFMISRLVQSVDTQDCGGGSRHLDQTETRLEAAAYRAGTRTTTWEACQGMRRRVNLRTHLHTAGVAA